MNRTSQGATLSQADLRGANLSDATLDTADIRGARLGGADFWDAILDSADLTGAEVSNEQLAQAPLLQRSTLPDSTKHE
jgi:uncharacterized protein YjbI with pentapeptide repeats